MTLPFRRRRHPRGRALAGGFPDTGETSAEILDRVRPATYNATATRFSGASGAGLHPDQVYGEADRAAGLRQYIEITAAAGPLARHRAPARYQPPAVTP